MKKLKREKVFVATTNLSAAPCGTCGSAMDAATGVSKEGFKKPKPGDVSICSRCGTFYVFDDRLRLRPASKEEISQADPEMRKILEQFVRKGMS